MLPKQWRLPLRKERGFFDQAKKHFDHGVTSFYSSSPDLTFAVIIKKSDFAKSTERNRAKRRVGHLLNQVALENQEIKGEEKIKGKFVFVLSRRCLKLDDQQLKNTLIS